jgi:hypothetical protein
MYQEYLEIKIKIIGNPEEGDRGKATKAIALYRRC